MNIRALIIVLLVIFSNQKLFAQKPVAVKYKWIDSMMNVKNDTTYIYNFWATWCIPCVAELPYFEKINLTYKNKKVKVILVSLDYVKKLNDVVIPFLKRKNITATSVLLNEPDANSWIDKIDAGWSGAIPATLIVNNSTMYRSFLEKELTFDEIEIQIKNSFNKK